MTASTVGVVALGALIFEAALIPGLLLGVAAALAPSYMPKVGTAFDPLLRSGIKAMYKVRQRTRIAMSEAREHVDDIMAEVNAEGRDIAQSAIHGEKRKVFAEMKTHHDSP